MKTHHATLSSQQLFRYYYFTEELLKHVKYSQNLAQLLLLLFHQEQCFHDFIIIFQEKVFNATKLRLSARPDFVFQHYGTHEWRESVSFLFQAVMAPRMDGKWKTIQGPCISESKDTKSENWWKGLFSWSNKDPLRSLSFPIFNSCTKMWSVFSAGE